MSSVPDLQTLPAAARTSCAALATAMTGSDDTKLRSTIAGGRQLAALYADLAKQAGRSEHDRRIYADAASVLTHFADAAETKAESRASRRLREQPFSKVERSKAAAKR